VDKYGAKLPLIIGPLIVSAGYLLYAVPGIGGSYWETFFPAIVTVGIGMGISVAPLTTTVMSSVDQDHSGLASGINNAVARTAGLLAIAVMGIIVFDDFSLNLSNELDTIEMSSDLRDHIDSERINLAGIQIPESVEFDTAGKIRKAINISFLSAFRLVMIISAVLALASSFTAFLSISGNMKSKNE